MEARIAELEQMLKIALEQRKQAYKWRLNRNLISAINAQIIEFRNELADAKAGA